MVKNTGFTLIEILVAVVVLAIGLLGLAALQAASLGNNQSAFNRSQATEFAYDLADRMRANSAGVATYTAGVAAARANCLSATLGVCTPADMAQNDLSEWNNTLSTNLPSGQGIVCLDSTPEDAPPATPGAPKCDGAGSTYAIKIWWDDERSGDASQLFITSFEL